jgi:hypothetical protein
MALRPLETEENRMIAKKRARLAMLGSLALAGQISQADDYFSPTDDRVRLTLGAMHVSSSTTLRADSSTQTQGTVLSGEDQFGLDKSDWEPKFQAIVRVATRQRLSFDYFTLDRSGSTTLSEPIQFRDSTFLMGDPLQTKLSLRTLGITYEYSFWHSEKLELAATLGVHATEISSRAEVQTQTRHVIQTDNQAGPVPTIGLDATWAISRRFYVDGRAQYLSVHVNNLDGSLGFYAFDALYRYRPNVSVGIGYTEITAHLSSLKSSQAGLFDFNTKGPEMFVRVAF